MVTGTYRPSRKARAGATKIAMYYRLTENVKGVEQRWSGLVYELYRDGELHAGRSENELKSLLTPFKQNLAGLRKMVAGMKTGLGGRSKVTGQGAHSPGVGIPTGSGEPGPDADEDEVTKRLLGITKKVLGKTG